MSRILCAISGVPFKVEHFTLYNSARESHHPIFDLSADKLLALSEDYVDDKFTDVENYLLYLALFKSTGLVTFRVPAIQTQHTQSIIAKNMIPLMGIVSKLQVLGIDRIKNVLSLPQFVISPDTKSLYTTKDWIEVWENAYKDYKDKYKSSTLLDKIHNMETNLERYIKDKTKDISTYAPSLARWAAIAGNFPTCDAGLDADLIKTTGRQMTLSEYWQFIIKLCAKAEPVYSIPDADIQELIEHCEENIEQGTIYAFNLMTLLRSASKKKTDFFAFGDIDVRSTFKILDPSASVEDANIQAMIDSAPTDKPVEKDYPNKLAYFKAKVKWETKQNYEKLNPPVPKENEVFRRASDITVEVVSIITSAPIPEIGSAIGINPTDAGGSL